MRIINIMPINETFFSGLIIPQNAPLNVHLAGITHKDPKYGIYRAEKNKCYILEYIISGKGHLYYGDRYFTPQTGDVYFLQPNVEHKYNSDPNDPWEKIWFNLSGPLISSLCEIYNLNGLVYFPECNIKNEFFKAAALLNGNNNYYEFCVQIHRIITSLHTWRSKNIDLNKTDDGSKLKKYIDTHWRSNITLEILAKQIRRSIPHTIRIFEHDWGMSPYQYLIEKRLYYACQYLENTNYSVKTLAGLIGFKDEFYFSNWFKKHKGVSPLFYRRRFRTGK